MLRKFFGVVPFVLAGWVMAEGANDRTISILDPGTSYNREVSWLLIVVGIFAAIVFIGVTAALILTVVRYRKTGNETTEPPQFHGNDALELWWTIIPTIVVLIIFGITAKSMFKLDQRPAGALKIEVTGHQFWWDFKYPTLGIRNSSEVVVPVGKPIFFEITSADVIHSFRIASMVGTQDAIPGIKNGIYVTPEKIGDYYGQCAEFCGSSHSRMRFRVKVVSQADFDAFVSFSKAPPLPTLNTEAKKGEALFSAQCAACHAVNGKPNPAQALKPDLTSFGSRTTVGSGIWENKPEYVKAWIKDSAGVKPGSTMPSFPNLKDSEVDSLMAYLEAQKIPGIDFSGLPKF